MSRRVNDGDRSGMKSDRYRNSYFEDEAQDTIPQGVSRKTINTIGGAWEDNRGRRSANSRRSQWDGSPFEDQEEGNWKNRQGWDKYYDGRYDRGNRNYGGSQLFHDGGNFHSGKGPKGYRRDDRNIYEDVCSSLAMSADVDASEVEVSVKDGIVYLKGTVTDRDQKKMAELEIENISGVTDVQNSLSIKKSQEDLH